ncbi:thiamine pyrophosphate-binding protein [Candidatus Endomicrobiellum devescovinae]|jgi:acetolactate synthase-1/2/3 large subunit|uniref:thiamine pyrophosphate-binding protein n=1 Tax=Candidatus Endomicrobiellum devescovinae TaxID=3242322 RepID=UPI00282BE0EF|nr:thiamine pyrophosphate-binding protein [Endomicrobium sp.]
MNVSEYIFDFLIKKGVDTAFVVTGGQAMYLDDALYKRKEIKTIFAHHEQTCGMSADAYSRITRKLGLAVVTAGPGSINVVNGLVGGYCDSAPMMIVSGQSALSFVKYQEESGIRQYGIQGIFIKPFVEKATKYFITIDDEKKLSFYLEKAYYMATNGRPGPVWIDVPLDIQRKEVSEQKIFFQPQNDINMHSVVQRKENVDKVFSLLQNSKKPLVIAGQGICLSNSQNKLKTFIERYNIPIVTTRLGIDIIESSHRLYVGRPGNYGERSANFAVQNADMVLILGSRLSTSSIGHDGKNFARNAKKIMVDIDEKELNKPLPNIDIKIKDDVSLFLDSLLKYEKVNLDNFQSWQNKCFEWTQKYPVVLEEYKREMPINSYYFTDRLSEVADKDCMILVDTGSCFHVASQVWKIKQKQRFLTTGGLSSMGYWAASIGACAAHNYQKTLVITGDGSLQMNIQEFATIKHNNLPIKVFVYNNNGYLLIRQTQRNFMDNRLFGESPKSGLWCPDSMKIADAYGIKGVRIEKLESIDEKIKEVLDYQGPVICDIVMRELQELMPRTASKKLPDGTLEAMPFDDMYPFLSKEEYEQNKNS